MNCEAIISEYRQAGENQRLHMFLLHRDLRMAFLDIENAHVTIPVGMRGKAGTTKRPWRRLAAAIKKRVKTSMDSCPGC